VTIILVPGSQRLCLRRIQGVYIIETVRPMARLENVEENQMKMMTIVLGHYDKVA
jgi:hypothetical protein